MRYIFLALAFCCINFFAAGQSSNYVKGTLDITVSGFNPCGSPAPDNGYLQIYLQWFTDVAGWSLQLHHQRSDEYIYHQYIR